jgi:hypothetical protein
MPPSPMFHGLFHRLAQTQELRQPALSCQPCGRLAQWLEHFLDTEGVGGSSPLSPTCSGPKALQKHYLALIRYELGS